LEECDAAGQAVTRYKCRQRARPCKADAKLQWLMEPFFRPPARKILPVGMVNNTLLPPPPTRPKQLSHFKISNFITGTAFA
jgi:hypothetical protein